MPKPIERTVLERVLRRVLPKRFIQYSEGPGEENPPMEEQAQAVPVQAPEAGSEPAGGTQAPADGQRGVVFPDKVCVPSLSRQLQLLGLRGKRLRADGQRRTLS